MSGIEGSLRQRPRRAPHPARMTGPLPRGGSSGEGDAGQGDLGDVRSPGESARGGCDDDRRLQRVRRRPDSGGGSGCGAGSAADHSQLGASARRRRPGRDRVRRTDGSRPAWLLAHHRPHFPRARPDDRREPAAPDARPARGQALAVRADRPRGRERDPARSGRRAGLLGRQAGDAPAGLRGQVHRDRRRRPRLARGPRCGGRPTPGRPAEDRPRAVLRRPAGLAVRPARRRLRSGVRHRRAVLHGHRRGPVRGSDAGGGPEPAGRHGRLGRLRPRHDALPDRRHRLRSDRRRLRRRDPLPAGHPAALAVGPARVHHQLHPERRVLHRSAAARAAGPARSGLGDARVGDRGVQRRQLHHPVDHPAEGRRRRGRPVHDADLPVADLLGLDPRPGRRRPRHPAVAAGQGPAAGRRPLHPMAQRLDLRRSASGRRPGARAGI